MLTNCGFELDVRAGMLDDGTSSILYISVGENVICPNY
jgi:hypothetical protein